MHPHREEKNSRLHDERVHVYDLWEITFWARQFGVSEAQLMRAVDKAGTSIQAVREELRSSAPSNESMLWKAKAV